MFRYATTSVLAGVCWMAMGAAILPGCTPGQQAEADSEQATEVVVERGPLVESPEHTGVLEAAVPARPQAMDPKVAELSAQIERIRRLARFAGQLEAAQQFAQRPDASEAQVQAAMEAGAKGQETLRLRQIELFLMEHEAQLRNINQGWHELTPAQRQPGNPVETAPTPPNAP